MRLGFGRKLDDFEMAELLGGIGDYFAVVINNALASERLVPSVIFLAIILAVSLHSRGYRLSWSKKLVESVGANIAFYLFNLLFGPIVFLMTRWVERGYDSLGIPSIDQSTWENVPAWLMVPLAVLCFDFANYWNHRILHMSWLWPVHAVHHSDPEVNGLTTYRIHFLEGFVMASSYIILLSWLGFPTDVMGVGAVFVGLHNIYVHLNVDWGHGPFRYLLASPRFHRWHHADEPSVYGKNLANVFPFFDVIFGTYHMPGTCHHKMGARGVPENDVVRLCLYPFAEWGRALKRAFRQVNAGRAGDSNPVNLPGDPHGQ